ncbi:MAG: hypothetical protein ACOCSN_02405 [Halanaeroarchaeum sp.]
MDIKSYGVAAAIQFLLPRQFIETFQRVAFRNPEEATLRRGIATIARFEGLAFLWGSLRGGEVSKPLRGFLGGIGVPMVLFPDRSLDVALRMAYSNADSIEVRSWVTWAIRVLGIAYFLVALGVLPRNGDE